MRFKAISDHGASFELEQLTLKFSFIPTDDIDLGRIKFNCISGGFIGIIYLTGSQISPGNLMAPSNEWARIILVAMASPTP
jgi:hypothetical protein